MQSQFLRFFYSRACLFALCLILAACVNKREIKSSVTPIPNLAGKILTVNGPIDPSQAGVALMHEHIFINFKAPTTAAGEWEQMTEPQKARSRLAMEKLPKEEPAKDEPAKASKSGANGLQDFDLQLSEVME